MAHALISIAAPLASDKVDAVRQQIEESLCNPASRAVRSALEARNGEDGVHFASLHALPGADGKDGHLLFEFSADGEDAAAITQITEQLTGPLTTLFSQASDWKKGNNLLDYLKRHVVTPGYGWFSSPGLNFSGNPGMSVGRIRTEARLARLVTGLVSEQPAGLRALERVQRVRSALGDEWSWALEPPPGPEAKSQLRGVLGKIGIIIVSLFKTYLWPFLAVALLIAIYVGTRETGLHATLSATAKFFGKALGSILAATVSFLGMTYLQLRRQEARDWTSDKAVSPEAVAKMFERENQCAQNHMISVTVRKPGWVRAVTVRLAFWVITTLLPTRSRPGFLGEIGTIHFARWITLPGTRDLVFLSNYGGSWESYLEDFITKAHGGLTAIWSNCIGFPKARNLFGQGATDGERFKRFARHSMTHTSFWYSAYPDLTTANIRTNAEIRRGLALAQSDDDAARWLSLFGSSPRPIDRLENSQIQSLVFGGLGFMPSGSCLMINMSRNTTEARALLNALQPHVAFNDGRMIERDAVLTLALAPDGLRKAGLPPKAISSFPAAFAQGMTAPGRARVLGDVGQNQPDNWWWGKATPDLALLIYGRDAAKAAALAGVVAQMISDHGAHLVHAIPLADVDKEDRSEPFGFADGISQPAIRGTYRAVRNPDPLHIVEPGEFILGYPDNRNNLPPGPTLAADFDPDRQLPILGPQPANDRDLGRNGTFIVIRQLEQDVDAFWDFCKSESARLKPRLGEPYQVSPEFIGAKMVGRWPDGSPLARWPYQPASQSQSHANDDPENDFLLGKEDPEGLRCPYGAHIRRANPRDSLGPQAKDTLSITNRHRILRVARQYAASGNQKPGLLFMCLNGDIERQFEFVQQTWAMSSNFHGLDGEADPLLGATDRFTIPTRDGPVRLSGLKQFVTMRGGGYFFLPGRRLLTFLAG
jgi:deferrochelatase/peroxidase EfeB